MGTKRPNTVTRATIARELHLRLNLPNKEAKAAADTVIDVLFESLSSTKRVEIRGFGAFRYRVRKAAVKHNPRKMEDLFAVPAHNRVVFVPAVVLKRKVIAAPLVKG